MAVDVSTSSFVRSIIVINAVRRRKVFILLFEKTYTSPGVLQKRDDHRGVQGTPRWPRECAYGDTENSAFFSPWCPSPPTPFLIFIPISKKPCQSPESDIPQKNPLRSNGLLGLISRTIIIKHWQNSHGRARSIFFTGECTNLRTIILFFIFSLETNNLYNQCTIILYDKRK